MGESQGAITLPLVYNAFARGAAVTRAVANNRNEAIVLRPIFHHNESKEIPNE